MTYDQLTVAELNSPTKINEAHGAEEMSVKEKKKKSSQNKKKGNREPKLLINTYNTSYDVIMKAASELGFVEKKVEPLFYGPPN